MVKRAPNSTLPMHEAVRLWHHTEKETFDACAKYVGELGAGFSLSWLRDAAPKIINGELSESALLEALHRYVPENAQDSVWAGVKLLMDFARENEWTGIALPHHDVPIGLGLHVRLRPSGMFYSPVRKERFLLTLQPRLDYSPTMEQERMWLSSAYYEFCCDPLQPLRPAIIDLARDSKTKGRRMQELGVDQLPILTLEELNSRLSLVASCYKHALEIVPRRARKERQPKDSGQGELFPGQDK